MVFYVIIVAMLNVCLGFGVAVYLGRRYHRLLADDEPWESMPFGESFEQISPDPAAEPAPGETQISDAAETDLTEPEPADTDTTEPEPTQPESEEPAAESEPTAADAAEAEATRPEPEEPEEPEAMQTEATDIDEQEMSQPPQSETAVAEPAETDEAAPETPETDEAAPETPETDEAAPETAETDEAAPEPAETNEAAPEPAETDEATPESEVTPPAPAATDVEDTAETDAARTDTSESDATEADTTKRGTAEADAAELDATKRETAEADAAELDATKRETAEADAAKLDATKRETAEADATEPETTRSETASSSEIAETAQPPVDETAAPEEPSEPAHQKGAAAVAATALKIDVEQFQEQLTELCDQLRSQAKAPEAGEAETCLDSISAATDEYLKNCKRPQAALDQLHREPELEKVGQQVQEAIQRHDEQAENLNATVAALDRQSDLAEGCRNIVEKTDELLSSGHQLRDQLDEAAAKIAEGEGTADQTDPAARTDSQTGLFNRAGLEAYLAQWWENDPERIRQLGAAMIDADEFAAVNAQFGYKTGNQMLSAVGRLLEAEIDTGVIVARFSGQRFFLLFPDGNARAATNGVEKVRQIIAKARFLHYESESRLTVSCASTAAILDDTSASLIARVETALQEAKRYGRNRTFLHEGEYPAPVVPPQFTLDERQITL